MSYADQEYNKLVKRILDEGVWDKDQAVRSRWSDGTPAYTKSLTGQRLIFPEGELGLLTGKEVKAIPAIHELFWIWQDKSNRLDDLRARGVNIWNAWEIKEGPWKGTIGKAYGYQLGKKCRKIHLDDFDETLVDPSGEYVANEGYIEVDQVDYLLHQLKHNPASRRKMTTLWDPDDLDDMSLEPCVWKTNWVVKNGKIDLIVGVRSNDIGVGGPFNYFQYAVLHRLIAQSVGLGVGKLQFDIDDAHVYDRHIENLEKQLTLPTFDPPELWINPDVTNFYAFTIDDIRLINYQHGPFIKFEVSI